jgi:hypothetical protein
MKEKPETVATIFYATSCMKLCCFVPSQVKKERQKTLTSVRAKEGEKKSPPTKAKMSFRPSFFDMADICIPLHTKCG